MNTIRTILRRRDGLDDDAIDDALAAAQADIDAILSGDAGPAATLTDLEDVISDHFGLEPDYLDDPELNVF